MLETEGVLSGLLPLAKLRPRFVPLLYLGSESSVTTGQTGYAKAVLPV
jgi:hypothetical protein